MIIKEAHENTRLTYNRIAGKYHELFKNEMDEKPFDREYLDGFAEYFDENSTICDAGCGPSAQIGRYLFDKGFNVSGIDISEKCIEIASSYNPDMKFQCADFLNWNIQPGSLDGIISYYSIIYTPKKDVDMVLQVFKLALVPGGKLLIVLKKGTFEGYQDEVLGFRAHSYFAEYEEDEIERILKRNGFVIEELITRKPYKNEIDIERIYCICSKP